MLRKYTEEELTHAILLIIDQGMRPVDAAKQTGINLRALQRYKSKYVDDSGTPKLKGTGMAISFKDDIPAKNPKVNDKLDQALIDRAEFLESVFATKKKVLQRIEKVAIKSDNLDALQRTIKTLNDLEQTVAPEGDSPAANVKTVNMFQFFNQQLVKDGYKGPDISDADIVKND